MLTFNFKKLSLNHDVKILDIGCGEGRHIFGALEAFPSSYLIGLDLNKDSLEICMENFKFFEELPHKDKKFVLGNSYKLPFKDDEFDLIVCSEVLEHLHEYNDALKEIKRVLKPRGYFLASVPAYFPEKICWMLSNDYQKEPGGHLRIFKRYPLIKEIEAHGFDCFDHERFHSLHSPYWWLRCFFYRNQDENIFVQFYKKILERQIMQDTPILDVIERFLNPVLGKSLSMYFKNTP